MPPREHFSHDYTSSVYQRAKVAGQRYIVQKKHIEIAGQGLIVTTVFAGMKLPVPNWFDELIYFRVWAVFELKPRAKRNGTSGTHVWSCSSVGSFLLIRDLRWNGAQRIETLLSRTSPVSQTQWDFDSNLTYAQITSQKFVNRKQIWSSSQWPPKLTVDRFFSLSNRTKWQGNWNWINRNRNDHRKIGKDRGNCFNCDYCWHCLL